MKSSGPLLKAALLCLLLVPVLVAYQNCTPGSGAGLVAGDNPVGPTGPALIAKIKVGCKVNIFNPHTKVSIRSLDSGWKEIPAADLDAEGEKCRISQIELDKIQCGSPVFANSSISYMVENASNSENIIKDACQTGLAPNICSQPGGGMNGDLCSSNSHCCSNACDLNAKKCVGPTMPTPGSCVGAADLCTTDTDCCSAMICKTENSISLCTPIRSQTYSLTLNIVGGGVVSGNGFTCSSPACAQDFWGNTQIQFTPTAATGQIFSSWSGDCDSTGSVTINSAKQCTATFVTAPSFNLTVQAGPGGVVTSSPSGISCSNSTCTASFQQGTRVTLSESPNIGYIAGAVSGDCDSNGQIVISGNGNCTATFVQKNYSLTMLRNGGVSSVCSTPAGLTVSGTVPLTASFPARTVVQFNYTGINGYESPTYGGDCSASGSVKMDQDRSCTINAVVKPNLTFVIGFSTQGMQSGLVESNPPGIKCGGIYNACSASFPTFTNLVLSAVAYPGYKFNGFTTTCAGGNISISPGTSLSCGVNFVACYGYGATCYSSLSCCNNHCNLTTHKCN